MYRHHQGTNPDSGTLAENQSVLAEDLYRELSENQRHIPLYPIIFHLFCLSNGHYNGIPQWFIVSLLGILGYNGSLNFSYDFNDF